MRNERSKEGYLLIDHSASPGISDAMTNLAGLPMGVGRGKVEVPTFTCSHCTRVVVINAARTRDRGYCPKCDHHVCDQCNIIRVASGKCKTYQQYIDETQENAIKSELIKEF